MEATGGRASLEGVSFILSAFPFLVKIHMKTLLSKRFHIQPGEIAQWRKVPAPKPDEPSLIPGTPHYKRGELTPSSCPWTSAHAYAHTLSPTYTNAIFKILQLRILCKVKEAGLR